MVYTITASAIRVLMSSTKTYFGIGMNIVSFSIKEIILWKSVNIRKILQEFAVITPSLASKVDQFSIRVGRYPSTKGVIL